MGMNGALRTLLGLALACALTSCDERGGATAEGCSTSATIAFEGREYTAVESLDGMKADKAEVGARLGVGEAPSSCGDDPGQRVQVFKVVGVPATQAVFAKPVYGLMARSNVDGTAK